MERSASSAERRASCLGQQRQVGSLGISYHVRPTRPRQGTGKESWGATAQDRAGLGLCRGHPAVEGELEDRVLFSGVGSGPEGESPGRTGSSDLQRGAGGLRTQGKLPEVLRALEVLLQMRAGLLLPTSVLGGPSSDQPPLLLSADPPLPRLSSPPCPLLFLLCPQPAFLRVHTESPCPGGLLFPSCSSPEYPCPSWLPTRGSWASLLSSGPLLEYPNQKTEATSWCF